MCREMAELGLEIARHAAQAALRPATTPQTPDPIAEPTPRGPTTPAAQRHHTLDAAAIFTRLVRAIRQILELEAKLSETQKALADRAAQRASDRAAFHLERSPKPAEAPPPAKTRQIPSLLANISREIGIDLQDPTLADRLPTFLRQTDPTGPPG